MGTPPLRLRLVFEDRSILNNIQRSDGMDNSWILLKSQQHRTISDVCTHLLHKFKLNRSCPNGIILSMEGFALPPFESTEILQDKEMICVKKKGNLVDEVENGVLEPGNNGLLLLENDNKEIGEYENESEGQSEDEELPEETVCKKRKASMDLDNLKKKKHCLGDEAETSNKKKIPDLNSKPSEEINKSPSIDKRTEENVEAINQVAKKLPSRTARRKKAKRKWKQELAKIAKKKPQPYSKPEVTKPENKDANGRPKGLLHWKQASKKPVGQVVNKPGHIRFDADQPFKQTGASNEHFRSSSKKKGKKWSGEKWSTIQKKRINKESFKILFKDAKVPVIDPNDFDNLPPCCEPKEGDVIAYRLLELNSSWIPEFSSFRVGRISYYDARDIVLIPVPEYPIILEKINGDGPNGSLYGEDASLEINYSALVDVRNIKQYDPNSTETVVNGDSQTVITNSNSNNNKTDGSKDSNPGDEVSPWDRFSKVNPKVNPEVGNSSMVAYVTNPCSHDAGGPSTKPESSEKGQNGNSSDPWLTPNKAGPSQENTAGSGWTDGKTTVPSENNCETGSSWGRPWPTIVATRGSSVKQPNYEYNWHAGSSRGISKPWSRGAPRGRGHGRGRGRGRNGDLM